MRKKWVLNSLILFVTLFLGLTYWVNSNTVIQKIQINDYNEYGEVQTSKKRLLPSKAITLKFKFLIKNRNDAANGSKYENLLQTADYNQGLRLEIARDGDNISSWALVYSDRQGKLQGIDLGMIPKVEIWHDMSIIYKAMSDSLIIFIDGQIVKTISKSNILIDFSNIVVGRGFDDSRVFSGAVCDFSIVNEYKIPESYQTILIYSISFLIIIAFFEMTLKFLRAKQISLSKSLILSISFLLAICFAGIFIIKSFYLIKVVNYTDIKTPISFNEPLDIVDDFSIEFDFLIYPNNTQSENQRYENIFQTANYNDGIRLEIGRKKEGTSLWALLYTDIKGELRAIDLNLMPSSSIWHKMKIHYIQEENRLDVFLDGINIRSYNSVDLKPNFNKIIVGSGFNGRYFDGEVKNFVIQKNFINVYIYLSLMIMSIIVFLFLIFNGLKHRYITDLTTHISHGLIKKRLFVQIISILSILSGCSFFLFITESYLVGENNIFRGIIIGLTSLGIIALLLVAHNLKLANYIRRPILAILYIMVYLYLGLFFASSLYILNRFADDVRRPYGLSIDEIAAVYQSSLSESFQFLITNLGYWQFALIVFVPLLIVIAIYYCLKKLSPFPNHKLTLTYVLVIISAFYLILPHISTFPTSLYAGFMRYAQQVDEIKKFKALKQDIKFDVDISRQTKGTHILVIGESANKEHMSAYGYFRDTTPWFDENLKNSNFVFFDNAYAPYVHTVPALLKILTMANQYNGMMQNSAPSILDIANTVGFRTYWISEQTRAMIDTPLSVLNSVAQHVEFVDEGGAILQALDKVMGEINPEENNLIILHVMGSHADYRQRLYGCDYKYQDIKKEEIGIFASEKYKDFVENILNPYDSTIRCTDDKLKQFFEMSAQKYPWVDSFIYFSDHGEDVYGQKFHNSADFSFPMTHVPLVMYFSNRYIEENRSLFQTLEAHKKSLFTTDLLFNTFLDILSFSSPSFEKHYSLAKDDYGISEENAIVMQKSPDEDGTFYTLIDKFFVKNDPLYISKKNLGYLNEKFPNKILAVDNDLIGKVYHSTSLGFKGIEFNVGAESFRMGHFPEYEFDTTLQTFLALSTVVHTDRLWFDLKSKKGHSIDSILEQFEVLDKQFNLKSRALIESWESGLDKFSDSGWQTSYYVWYRPNLYATAETYKSNFDGCSDDTTCAKAIAQKVLQSKAKSISFFYNEYEFIKTFLEPLLPSSITYNIFGLSYDFQIPNPNMIENVKSNKIFLDPRVRTILLDGPQIFRYRP